MSLCWPFPRATFWLAALWLGLLQATFAQPAGDLQPVPPLTTRVTDRSHTLTAAQRDALEAQLAAFEKTQGSQIVILLLPSTQPEDIAAYANRVFNTWKPGRPGVGDGLLLLVAVQDRRVRIEVGRALEGAVPDLAAKRIIDEVLTPHFRQGDFAGGLRLASERLMGLIRGEGLPAPGSAPRTTAEPDWMNLTVLLFIVLPVAGSVLRRMLGHKLGTLATGGLVGFVAFSFTASLLIAGMAALLAMLLTFMAGTPLGSALLASAQQRHSHGGHWDNGVGGGFDGGGTSGGGFSSGGGGDGAGGGASGSW
jgi:uncharacterized protein